MKSKKPNWLEWENIYKIEKNTETKLISSRNLMMTQAQETLNGLGKGLFNYFLYSLICKGKEFQVLFAYIRNVSHMHFLLHRLHGWLNNESGKIFVLYGLHLT